MNKDDKRKIRVGLVGLGTVGGEVACRLLDGVLENVVLAKISARDRGRARRVDAEQLASLWVDDPLTLVCDEVDVIVELIGGTDGIALTLVETALAGKKSVVSANKAMLATHGARLAAMAAQNGVTLAYEAAVAGGIPIIKIMREGLVGNRINHVHAILNGTCNFILCQMHHGGINFATALKLAQEQGFAEAVPDLDVDGIDSAQKLALLSSLAFGIKPRIDTMSIMGVRSITLQDIRAADRLGFVIRLLASADAGGGQEVTPVLIPKAHILAGARDEANAVFLNTDLLGDIFVQGAGAGGCATASAVLADISDIAGGFGRMVFSVPAGALVDHAPSHVSVLRSWYLRINLAEAPGQIARASQILAACDISIETLIQEPTQDTMVPVLFMTHPVRPQQIDMARAQLESAFSPKCDILILPVFQGGDHGETSKD